MKLHHNDITKLARLIDGARRDPGNYCQVEYVEDRDGVHGRNHLVIDAETLEVSCSKCTDADQS